jgi:hypothetical protein
VGSDNKTAGSCLRSWRSLTRLLVDPTNRSADPFALRRLAASTGKNKNKANAGSDDDDAASGPSDEDDDFASAGGSDEEEEEAYKAPKATGSAKKKGGAGGGRKPRASAANGGTKKTPTQRKPRAKKNVDGSDEEEEEVKGAKGKGNAKDFKIEGDNELFSALFSPCPFLLTPGEPDPGSEEALC